MKLSTILTAAAVLGAAGIANAQYNVNLGTLAVGDSPMMTDLNGAAIPAGNYTSYSVSVDWVAGGGNPFSNEAIFALTDSMDLMTATFYADPGPSADAASSGDPVTLTWNGFLDTPYQGGDPLFLNTLQTFSGSDATWNNVDITLDFATVAQPTAIDLGTNPGGSMSVPLNEAEITWFCFDVVGGAGAMPWSLDTIGSTNTGGSFADDDTELALYAADGTLLATNDDEDFGAGILTSLIDSDGTGALADGKYFIAAGSFNSMFASNFDATSTSTATGTTVLNYSFVPAPGAMALMGLAGVAGIRRRR